MKVQWRGQPVGEATWEIEQEMHSKYPHLFETLGMILNPFEDERLFKRGENVTTRPVVLSIITPFPHFLLILCFTVDL